MISLILMSLAGICKSIMDTLQFHYDKSIFPIESVKVMFWNPIHSWKNKYKNYDTTQGPKFFGSTTIFVAFTDGWHLFGMINSFLICAAIVLYSPITPIKIKALSILVDFLIIKIAHQCVFHILFTYVLKAKNK